MGTFLIVVGLVIVGFAIVKALHSKGLYYGHDYSKATSVTYVNRGPTDWRGRQ